MNDVTARNRLAEHKWKLYNTADMGLLPDGQVARYIEGIAHKEVDSLVQFLERFVSVVNYDAGDSIRYAYVTAPLIDNQPKAGKWRAVQVRTERVDDQGRVGPDGSTFRIIQVLAEGFLSPNGTGSLDGADARLVEYRNMQKGGEDNNAPEYATIEWVGVDPDNVKAIASQIVTTYFGVPNSARTLTVRKVQHNGVTTTVSFGTGWDILISAGLLAEDGSGTVRLRVGKNTKFTLDAFDGWGGGGQSDVTYIWNIPHRFATTMIATFKTAGATVAASYDDQNGFVNLVVRQLNLTGVTLDTGWYPAGDNESGQIQKRVAFGQTLAAAKTIADSAPATGSWFTNGNISGPDQYGNYSVMVSASAAPATYSVSTPYKSYSFNIPAKKRMWSTKKDGTRQTRLVPVTHYYVGNTSESAVETVLEAVTNIEGVRVTANGNGTYFQGYGYVIGTLPSWSDDDT